MSGTEGGDSEGTPRVYSAAKQGIYECISHHSPLAGGVVCRRHVVPDVNKKEGGYGGMISPHNSA